MIRISNRLLILFLISIEIAPNALANPLFRYQIIFPDNEQKIFFVDQVETKVRLSKTKWSCEILKKNADSTFGVKLTPYHLICRYGGSPAGVAISQNCLDVGHSTARVNLSDGAKEFVVVLECGIPGT